MRGSIQPRSFAMPTRTALIALAILAATVSISASHAGMNNVNLTTPRMPNPPDVRPRMIDAKIQLHCYYRRERNELGVWVDRRHCN
jgi:hypothetical protein